MIPQLADGEGHDLDCGALGVSKTEFELRCLIEIVEAHAEGRKVSFKVPSAVHEQGANT